MSLLTKEDIALAWIGTNDPIELGGNFKDSEHVKNFAANLEAAWLAKLASAELPEPAVKLHGKHKNGKPSAESMTLYTADQLRQAYAQGAASQLDRLEKAEKDAERLVWAMHNMSNPFGRHEFGFSQHVFEQGSTGDIDDCRTYIDAAMEASK